MNQTKSRAYNFFSNPIVGITGTFASILSVFLAILFYNNSKSSRELTYLVNPVKSIIASVDNSTDMSVTYKNNPIKGNISSMQVAFWNSGKESIKKENILQPLVFSFENNVEIIEVRIVKTSRKIINIKLNEEEIKTGKLALSWDILEYNDGAVIQFIYNSSPDIKINVSAIIEGQSVIAELKYKPKIQSLEQYMFSQTITKIYRYFFVALSLIMLIVYIWQVRRRFKKEQNIFQRHDLLLLFNVALMIVLIYEIYEIFYDNGAIGPPFGF